MYIIKNDALTYRNIQNPISRKSFVKAFYHQNYKPRKYDIVAGYTFDKTGINEHGSDKDSAEVSEQFHEFV